MSAGAIEGAGTTDSETLREAARRLLTDKVDRRAGYSDPQREVRTALEGEMTALGWKLLTVPESRDGLGQGFAALAPIYEELGRTLAPVTMSGTMAAVDVLSANRDEAGSALLDRIVTGEARVAVVFPNFALNSKTIDATFNTLCDADHATDLLILPYAGPPVLVALESAGVTVEPIQTWDRSRYFADIHLAGAASTQLDIDAAAAGRIARAHLDLAMAWDCIGAAEQALEEAVAYMGIRRQFDRPIGSFQSLKHRAADLKVGLELARALACNAGDLYAMRGDGWDDRAGQARLLAVRAFRAIAEDAIQFHGGIGFTWEHDCHTFLKRALMNEMLGETEAQVSDRIAPGIFSRALVRA
jgi:alkylation response protein AidB-like acyl-CoA dehydrogenase